MLSGSKKSPAPNNYLIKHLFHCSFLLLLFFIASCKDNSVSPVVPQNSDTTDFYTWKVDTFYNYSLKSFYIADSNNIFINGYPNPLYYDGNSYSSLNFNDPGFYPACIAGFDKNNVYFGGGSENDPIANAVLKKWNGSSFQSFTIPDDSTQLILNLLVLGPDELWLAPDIKNYIYYFNSGVFTRYIIDTNVNSGSYLYRNSNGELYAFSFRYANIINVYKFQNNSFNLLFVDTTGEYHQRFAYYFATANSLIASGPSSLYNFTNNNWAFLCNTPNFVGEDLAGTSLSNLASMISGQNSSGPVECMVWNGSRWRKEDNLKVSLHSLLRWSNMFCFNSRVYLSVANSLGLSYLIKGTPKK